MYAEEQMGRHLLYRPLPIQKNNEKRKQKPINQLANLTALQSWSRWVPKEFMAQVYLGWLNERAMR